MASLTLQLSPYYHITMANLDASYLLIVVHYDCDDFAMYYVEEEKVPADVMKFIRNRGNSDRNPIFENWLWHNQTDEDGNGNGNGKRLVDTLNRLNSGETLPPGNVTVHVCYYN